MPGVRREEWTMSELVWEDPPPSQKRTGHKWAAIQDQLDQKPGEWAMIAESKSRGAASSTAHQARDRLGTNYEVVSRIMKVYARRKPTV